MANRYFPRANGRNYRELTTIKRVKPPARTSYILLKKWKPMVPEEESTILDMTIVLMNGVIFDIPLNPKGRDNNSANVTPIQCTMNLE